MFSHPPPGQPKPWVGRLFSNPRVRFRLFCFPYAGSGASMFRLWPKDLHVDGIEVCPIHLPGRESRLVEPAYTRVDPLVHELAEVLQPHLTVPYAFFGHSMGALISFELARLLRKQQSPFPAYLFLAAHRAAHLPNKEASIHQLAERDFIEALRELNGTPAAVLESHELMQLVLPTLRADAELCETYTYRDDSPLECGIAAFGGIQDSRISYEEIAAWREQTRGPFTVQMLPGDHFFVHQSHALLLQMLSQHLLRLVSQVERKQYR